MDISPSGLIRNWLPQLPGVLRTAILSALQQTSTSEHQDWLTQIIVQSARPILQTPCALLKSQIQFNQDFGVWGRMWIAKYTVPRPVDEYYVESDKRSTALSLGEAVEFAIKELASSSDQQSCDIPPVVDVETEWTGYRSGVSHVATRPQISEREMYHEMIKEVDSDGPVILYFHGGAFCLMDPAIERWPTSSLAQKANGRVLAVRYRLAPQNMFPAALIDALMVYLSLIAPPKYAYHDPVLPSQIVLAGDSSGAGLAASLHLLLLTLARNSISIRFHGQDVKIPDQPCTGLTLASPWLDVSRSLPSTSLNAPWDIIAPPPLDAASPPFPPDAIWPTSPPRSETYCYAQMVSHPLVSPLAAKSEHWKGSPPVYLCVGWEGMQDEAEVFARRVYESSDDAIVVFDGYQGMPHCFSMFPWNQAGRTAQDNWAGFCRQAVLQKPSLRRKSAATWTSSKTGEVTEVRLSQLGLGKLGCGYDRTESLTDAIVAEKMQKARKWRRDLEADMLSEWKALPPN